MHTQRFEDHSSRFEESVRFFLGATVSQPPGGGALCVVRRRKSYEYRGNPINPVRHFKTANYEVGHLERLPSGMAYPEIIARISEVQRQPAYSGGIEVTVNVTEVGKAFLELCHSAKLHAMGITITTGDAEVYE